VVTLGDNCHGAKTVDQFGSPELKQEVLTQVLFGPLPGVPATPAGGRLGPVAMCRQSVRDGDGWIIHGSKMSLQRAQRAVSILVTNSIRGAEKHQS